MSEPVTSVTEGRVTVTANDTEANIREAAGFADPAEAVDDQAADGVTGSDTSRVSDRNDDGTFKAKAPVTPAEPVKPAAAEGDPRKSYQAKINAAIGKQREAERRAEEAERRAQERETELQALRQPVAPPQPTAPPVSATSKYLADVQRYQALPDAPRYDNFVAAGLEDPYTMHQAAMAAFIADRRQDERDAKLAETAQHRERQSHVDTSYAIAAEAHPEFATLLAAPTQQAYPPAVIQHLQTEAALDPSLSAELFHHLLTHPEDAARLATMTHPIAAAREIGRLTAQVSSASPGPETLPPTTTAKPLIKPVRPSVMAHESASPDDLPFGPRYIAAMNEQDRKAREARRA